MELPDELLCLFNAQVQERNGSYIIEVPKREVDVGDVEAGNTHRVAMFPQATTPATAEPVTATSERLSRSERAGPEPPVEEGEVVDVDIEDIGDQGDGIARVGPGYIVIIPDTKRSERVAVEIADVRENMAFAEVVDRHDQRR